NLAFLAAHAGDIGRQTVQVECFAIFCCCHELFCACPVFVLCILSQQFLLQLFDALEVAAAVQFRTFLHGSERSPAFRIYDVGVFECLCHIVCLCEGSAGLCCVLCGNSLHFREHLISFRMGEHNVHSETGHQTDDALGNGERLAVGRRVCP